MEEIARARGISRRRRPVIQMLRHLRGVPHRREDSSRSTARRPTGVCARRAAHRDRHRAQRTRVLHARRHAHERPPRPGGFPAAGAEEQEHLGTLEKRYARADRHRSAARVASDVPVLQGRGQRHLRRRRREAARRASTICRRCSSASAASAARTSSSRTTASGSRTPKASRSSSSSPTKSATHRDLLIARVSRAARAARPRAGRRDAARRPRPPPIDRPAYPYDRVRRHAARRRSSSRAPPPPASPCSRSPTTTRWPAARPPADACARAGIEFVPASKSPRSSTARTSTCSATSSISIRRRCWHFSPSSGGAGSIASREMFAAARARTASRSTPTRSCSPALADSTQGRGPSVDCTRARRRPAMCPMSARRSSSWLSRGRPGFVPRDRRSARGSVRAHSRGRRAGVARASRCWSSTTSGFRGFAHAGLDALEAYHSDHDAADTARYLRIAARLDLARHRRLRLSRRRCARRRRTGQRVAAARAFEAL